MTPNNIRVKLLVAPLPGFATYRLGDVIEIDKAGGEMLIASGRACLARDARDEDVQGCWRSIQE